MKIAYIMSRFPLLSETFILREMIEVEKQGHQIVLFPLICQNQTVVHEEAQKWLSRARCIPFASKEIFSENLKFALKNPKKYFTLLFRVIIENLASIEFTIRGVYLFPKAIYTAQKIETEQVDHIHAHYATHPGLEAWLIHNITGINYSITIHSHDIYDCHAMLKTKLRDAEFLVPISAYNIEYMANLLGEWIRPKCHVVHCGIDPTNYQPPSPIRQVDNSAPYEIIQIGSLHWKKGQVYLIQAISILRERGLHLRLRIIGDGEERPKVEAAITKYHLEDVVELMGARTQSEVAQILPQADCYVQSSVSEGIPVAIMEALACERPVVATNITGIPELVLHNETGLLVPPADALSLANAIEAIRANPEKAMEMGKRGREYVKKEFNLENNIKKLISLFEDLRGAATANSQN